MLLDDSRQLRFCMQGRIRSGETMRQKISRQRAECFLIAPLKWSGVRYQNRLVVLSSPGEKSGNERDADAATLVPK